MKIKIAYQEEDGERAGELLTLMSKLLSSNGNKVKVKKSDKHKPFYHIYLETDKPKARQQHNKREKL